jgi:cytidylate kinase
MNKNLQIAIDGPVASGKGDIAARLAKKFGLVNIYTGAMYRMLALACLEAGVSLKDSEAVMGILSKITLDLGKPVAGSSYSYSAWLNGRDVTERIIHQDAAMGASDVSKIPQVRAFMVIKQQAMAKNRSVVMEGRDIGLRVLPKAHLKIFLTASVEERARRRQFDWQAKGYKKTLAETLEDTKNRDLQDTTRATDPLTKVADAWEIDTTELKQEEVVSRIEGELKRRGLI